MFCRIGGGPFDYVHIDSDDELCDYIRVPVPRLPDHVGFLDEEQLTSLADKHIAANDFDESEAQRYLRRAIALRAELSECEAKAEQHTKSLQKGRDVVSNLYQGILYRQRESQREAAQQLSAKRKRVSHILLSAMARKSSDLAPSRPKWRWSGHTTSAR